MKKKVFTAIAIIVAVFVIAIGYIVVQDFKEEDKLKKELEEIANMVSTENVNMEEINIKLERTVTRDDYGVIEKAYKQYLSDSFKNMIEMVEILNDDKITKILTAENYKNDGPEFNETKNYIKTTIQDLESNKTKYYELFTEEKAMSYIEGKSLDSYYVDFYRQQIVGNIEEKQDKTVENSINEIIALLKNSEKVINFLSNNKDNWKIEGNNIAFNSVKLSDEYNKLLQGITERNSNTYNKDFGSYEIPENWVESKEHSTSNKFFYILKGQEDEKRPNNISINVGKNKYTKKEHEKFKTAILNQISMQIAGSKDVEINANGSNTDNGYIVYTFEIKEKKDNTTTTQYYIIEDYKYALIQETTFEESKEADNVAKVMVNSFKWKE